MSLADAREIRYGAKGEPIGYWTWFAGLYVCLTCGHLCECSEDDWVYGQRYNAAGEWNPRLILDESTGEYVEPDELPSTK